jgi:phage head maturation protease
MKIYLPIAKVDAECREVWGYASTEARDDQGELVKRDALIAALGDYMRFANIREMHQLSAVGVAQEAAVDDKGLYVGARIVDDRAWQKVVEGVYKGYSIGGRVTQRDPADYKTITGLVLNEISLVDRPANPEAVFDYWKAAGASDMADARFNPPIQIWACGVPEHRHLAKADALKCQEHGLVYGGGLQTSETGRSETELITAAKSAIAAADGALDEGQDNIGGIAPYSTTEYADPGYQTDGKKRYPVDTERHIRAAWNFINRPSNARRYTVEQLGKIKAKIIAAWKKEIDEEGPPSANKNVNAGPDLEQISLTKALWDVGHVARIILDLDWLKESLSVEASMEGDDSPQAARLQVIIAELCIFLNALVAEETGEILDDSEIGSGPVVPDVQNGLVMAAGTAGTALIADICKAGNPKMRRFATALLAKARHSEGDQALLDLAYHSVDKCMGLNGLLFAERSHLAKARAALEKAGAAPIEASNVITGHNSEVRAPMGRPSAPVLRPGGGFPIDTLRHSPSSTSTEVLDMIAAALGKRGSGHQALMDVAHDCVGKLTDGALCATAKAGARHSREILERLAEAHDHLVAAGAKCHDADHFVPEVEWEGTELDTEKMAAGNLAKVLAGERAVKATLIATLTDIVPRLDQLTKRVEEIARTPLPPLTMTKSVTAISKQQDSGGNSGLSPDDLAAAFSRMSKEEQTLTLIKASYANPIHPPGLGTAKELRGG